MRMHTRRYLIITAGIFVALVILSNAARERVVQKPLIDGDNVVFVDDYRLTGEVDETLFVVAGTIALEASSRIDGDVALVSNSILLAGEIEGSLTATGGEFRMSEGSRIEGDATIMVSSITLAGEIEGDVTVTSAELILAPGTQIEGDLIACVDTIRDQRTTPGTIRPCGDIEPPGFLSILRQWGVREPVRPFQPETTLVDIALSGLFSALLLGGLGGLAVTFFPQHIAHIQEAIQRSPRDLIISGFMADLMIIGLIALVVVVLAILPPAGVILLPVVVLVGLLYVGMALAGLVTLALMLGDWLMSRSQQPVPPLVTVAVGSIAISLVIHLLMLLPLGLYISLLLLLVMATIGVGAAALTRGGTRSLRQAYFVQG
jgi:cytoskeletal protein CcmA (bactofilin family)